MANVITAKKPNVITAKQPNVITSEQPNVITQKQPNVITPIKPVITPIKPVVTPVKPIIPSVVLKPTEPIAIKPAVIQQANMELSNGSAEQALNTLKSAEQEAVQQQHQGSTETKGEPSWPEEPEYDYNETETTDDKPSNLKWWLIGGIGGALLITAIVVIIIVAKRKK